MADIQADFSSRDKPDHLPPHRSLAELAAGLGALPRGPRDLGTLALIVRRTAPGVHETLAHAELSPSEGLPGDQWSARAPCDPRAQLAVMRRETAELIAHGRPLSAFGDNLFVDLDISAANLPPGTRLRVGRAVVETTPLPHNGCRKFRERFGPDALRFVQAPETRDQNLRGIYWKVVAPGRIEAGAAIKVLSRP